MLRDMSIDRGILKAVVFHLFLVPTSSVGLAGYARANISVFRWLEPYQNLRKAGDREVPGPYGRKGAQQAGCLSTESSGFSSFTLHSAKNLKRYLESSPNCLISGYFQVCFEGKDRCLSSNGS